MIEMAATVKSVGKVARRNRREHGTITVQGRKYQFRGLSVDNRMLSGICRSIFEWWLVRRSDAIDV